MVFFHLTAVALAIQVIQPLLNKRFQYSSLDLKAKFLELLVKLLNTSDKWNSLHFQAYH